MSLTGGYDFCVELAISVVREIFHLAFKQEDRFPHNYGPFERTYSVAGGSDLHATVRVRVYDEVDRPAELRFTEVQEMTFTFPMDLEVQIAEAPNPELASFIIQAIIEAPGALAQLPSSEADGTLALGIDFSAVTADDITVLSFSGVPTVDSQAVTDALHQAYESGQIPHTTVQDGFTLTIYDGNRDASLVPPNSSGAEIGGVLGADNWVAITFPVHVGGTQEGYVLNTKGTVVLHRQLVRDDFSYRLKLGTKPPAADAAHQTVATLDDIPGVDIAVFLTALHNAYAANTLPHLYPPGALETATRILFYDGTQDLTLVPAHPDTAAITATLETESGKTFLHIRIPCYAFIADYLGTPVNLGSYGWLNIHREVVTTPTLVSIDFAAIPAEATRKTNFEMTMGFISSGLNNPLFGYTAAIDSALAGVGVKSGDNPSGVILQIIQDGFDTAATSIGDVIQAAPSDAQAQVMLREEIAAYLKDQKFPIYTPDPGENEVTIEPPVGRLLVAEEIMAIQMNRRTSLTEGIPEAFLGAKRLALATSKPFIDLRVLETLLDEFPGLYERNASGDIVKISGGKDRIEEVTNRNVWLTDLNVELANGQFNVSGTVVIEVCCWKDPEVSFDGNVTLDVAVTVTPEGCKLDLTPVPHDFDTSQSSSDIVLEIFVPVVGWIVAIVIECTIAAVKDGVIANVVDNTEDVVEVLPPVVFGIAQVWTCLEDVALREDGVVMSGRVEVSRVDRSFEDLESQNRRPGGGDS